MAQTRSGIADRIWMVLTTLYLHHILSWLSNNTVLWGWWERKWLLDSTLTLDKDPVIRDPVTVKRRLGLRNAVMLTVGQIIGSGIFVAPKDVLSCVQSVGMSLVVWVITGVFAVLGAMCFIELGTSIPSSGGAYTYIRVSFGEMLAFLYLYVNLLVSIPAGTVVVSLTFANYILESFSECLVSPAAVRLVAALPICLLTFINCRNVRWVTRVQDLFTSAKVIALVIIIIAGVYHLSAGHTENFENAFAGMNTKPGYLALSLYSGIFSYSGWNSLNMVMEELEDPFRNLPRAIYISLPLVTVIYVLANAAYFAVLSPEEILTSNAVAVVFGKRMLGVMSWIMPFSVAVSTFGCLNGGIFGHSRLLFVGAREGHLPSFLSMINLDYLTPAPCLVLLCFMSLIYLSTTEVYTLIHYTVWADSLFSTIAVASLLWLRYKQPDLKRPIKVNILLPIAFLIICIFLITLPFFVSPWNSVVGLVITITGIPVYMVTVHWKNKPLMYRKIIGKITSTVQKLLMSVPEDKHD